MLIIQITYTIIISLVTQEMLLTIAQIRTGIILIRQEEITGRIILIKTPLRKISIPEPIHNQCQVLMVFGIRFTQSLGLQEAMTTILLPISTHL